MVLGQLLTGVLPFGTDYLRTKGIDHLRRVIREEEPRSPSTKITGLDADEVVLADDVIAGAGVGVILAVVVMNLLGTQTAVFFCGVPVLIAAVMTLPRTVSLSSPGSALASAPRGSFGTSTCMSMRSSSGPEILLR